jgi:hypothetical protein
VSSEEKFLYLSHIAQGAMAYDFEEFGNENALYTEIVENAKYPNGLRKNADLKSVESLLRNAWQTEAAARWPLVAGDSDVRRVMCHTLAMHVYYSIFNLARATCISEGKPNPSHEGIHNDFRSDRRRRATGSWSFYSTGDPGNRDSIRLQPGNREIPRVQSLSWGLTASEYLGLCFLTGRKWHIEYKKRDFLKKQKLKQLRGTTRNDFFQRNRESSLLDLVYQFRCHANYEEIDEYGSAVDDDIIERFYRGLIHVCTTGLLHYEAMVVSRIGLQDYSRIAHGWASRTRLGGSTTPAAPLDRLQFLASVSDSTRNRNCPNA